MKDERKELFSEKLQAGKRTYFFDVKETTDKEKYLVISESRPAGEKSFVHSRVMVFEEHIKDFIQGLKKAIDFIKQENESKT